MPNWDEIFFMLTDYGFLGVTAHQTIIDAQRGDEYAISVCILVAKLEPQDES